MYLPQHFAELDQNVLRDEVRKIRAGHLITMGSQGLEASFIPLLISDDATTVTGHLAKTNEQWRRADVSVPALITWVGADAYVSPSYYPSKQEHGKVTPTWNYINVQAKGIVTFHESQEWKRSFLEQLINFHEKSMPQPWSIDDAPADFIDGMVKGTLGFELQVTSLEGKWKLSQNRSASDVNGVIAGLGSLGLDSTDSLVRDITLALEKRPN